MAARDRGQPKVRSLLRGLELLRALNESSGLTATQLASQCGMARITVYRLLRTLERDGYVRRADDGRYMLGASVLSLGSSYARQNWLLGIAVPEMQAASRELGWPLALSTNNGPRMVVQHTTIDETGFWLKLRGPGSTLPLLRTAMGLAYLAMTPKRIAGPLIRAALELDGELSPELVRDRSRVERLLEGARRSGVVSVRDAWESEHVSLSAVGVAVTATSGPVGALALVYYSASMGGAEAARRFGPDLRRLAARIATQI